LRGSILQLRQSCQIAETSQTELQQTLLIEQKNKTQLCSLMMESNGFSFWEVGLNGVILRCNKTAATTLGLPGSSAAVRRHLSDFVSKEAYPGVAEVLSTVKARLIVQHQIALLTVKGEQKQMDVLLALQDHRGDSPHITMIGVVKETMRGDTPDLHLPTCMTQKDCRICDCSAELQELLGVSWHDAVGERFVDFCMPQCREECNRTMRAVLVDGKDRVVPEVQLNVRRQVPFLELKKLGGQKNLHSCDSPKWYSETFCATINVFVWRDTAGQIVGLKLSFKKNLSEKERDNVGN